MLNNPLMDGAQIKQLATLEPLEYEQQRKEAAKTLGVRASVLDQEVHKKRVPAESENDQLFTDPDPWPEPVDGAETLSAIESAFNEYMVMPSGAAAIAALWVAHTHCFECFEHTPRLNISAPEKQCGKTVMLDIVGTLVPRAIRTENTTTAVVFRLIDGHRPTLLIDEYDSFLGNNDELRGALNAGHRRGGSMLRCQGDDHEVKAFKTFAPVALAGIGDLPGTLHDRSIIVRLQRALNGEIKRPFDSRKTHPEKILCRKLARWAQDNEQALNNSEPDMGGIFNRQADNWRPLFAIAEVAGGEWPARARTLSLTFNQDDENDSKGVLLLRDVQKVFDQVHGDKIFSCQLVDRLIDIEDSPWNEWNRGRPITANTAARLLKTFSIKSRTVRIGVDRKKGYHLKQFNAVFARYLGDQSVTTCQSNEHGGCSDFQSVTRTPNVTLTNRLKANNDGDCHVVTVQNSGNGEDNYFEGAI